MTNTSGLAAALAAALLATGCAMPKDAPLPPVATAEPLTPPSPEAAEPAATSIAALGLRGASAPAGGASTAAAGRAETDGAGSVPTIAISYPPTDESGLDALLTSLETAPPAEAEPEVGPNAEFEVLTAAVEPPLGLEEAAAASAAPAFETMALAVEQPAPPAAEPTPVEIAPAPVIELAAAEPTPSLPVAETPAEPEAEPVVLSAADEPAAALAAAVLFEDAPPEPAPAPALAVATAADEGASSQAAPGMPRLADFYACNYAPAQRMGGGVNLVTCR